MKDEGRSQGVSRRMIQSWREMIDTNVCQRYSWRGVSVSLDLRTTKALAWQALG
jgi:hypothetical protein